VLPRWFIHALARRSGSPHEALRALASVASGFPLQALPTLERVLLLAPHPDDEILGAGGTMARLAALGCDVTVAIATAGEGDPHSKLLADELMRRRQNEAAQACAVLGLRPPSWWGLPDGQLPTHHAALAEAVARAVAEVRPQVVFMPWFGEGHADHAALGKVPLPDDTEVWAYEIWTPLPAPNRLVDITTVIDRKRDALACHTTAGRTISLEALLALSRYRSAHGLFGQGWAEAFFVTSAEDYRTLWQGQ